MTSVLTIIGIIICILLLGWIESNDDYNNRI